MDSAFSEAITGAETNRSVQLRSRFGAKLPWLSVRVADLNNPMWKSPTDPKEMRDLGLYPTHTKLTQPIYSRLQTEAMEA